MKIDLFDFEEFIKVNKLEEVTDPMLFNNGAPSSEGLLSTDIFGNTSRERKVTYGYISLNGWFLHPFIYKLLKRMNRNFEHIVHATRKYIIDNTGTLVADEEKGETGLIWLYNNWEKLDFKKNNSLMRNERIDVLNSYKKNVLFTKYWLVMPAFYRDVNLQAVGKGEVIKPHEINTIYSKIIRYASMLTNENDFSFVLDNTRANLQETLVELYDDIKHKVEKKHGLIRKNLLGKSIDHGSRLVISAPTFHANRPEDVTIDFYHTGIPLSHCCSLFFPFLMPWLRNFFRQQLEMNKNKYPAIVNGEQTYVELDDPELFFNEDYLKKQINNFVFSVHDRYRPIEIPVKNREGKKPSYMSFTARVYEPNKPTSQSPMINRPAVWCDVFYQAMVDICKDKCVYITRYPVNDYFGTFPTQITVLSTIRTVPFYVGDKVYQNYPDIDYYMNKPNKETSFIDTASFSNLYCKGLSADYDGDQISIKAVYSQEANKEAIEMLHSKKHLLNISGENMRSSSNEAIQTLYALTK